VIRLGAGDWRAVLAPALGGAVMALAWRDRPILRPTPPDADDPLQAACFPLVPYANRIDRGRFAFDGEAHDIGATPGFEPHALHGVGWRTAWNTAASDKTSARLTLDHPGSTAWPWGFHAEQAFNLSHEGLRIDLTMTNTAGRAAPAGLGLHPYLHRGPGDRLALAAPHAWAADATLIPSRLVPASAVYDWRAAPRLAQAPFVDNAYEGWDGSARLIGEDGVTALVAAPGVSRVHVYAPLDADFVCVEPVTHRPDALNAPAGEDAGLAVLRPGETLTLSMTLGVQMPGASGKLSDL